MESAPRAASKRNCKGDRPAPCRRNSSSLRLERTRCQGRVEQAGFYLDEPQGLAPRAKDRDKIVAYGRPSQPIELDLPLCQCELFDDDENIEDQKRRTSRYYTWSELMERVFSAQILCCPKCDSTLRLIALVTAPATINAILTHIGLETPLTLRPHFQQQLLLFDRPSSRRSLGEAGRPHFTSTPSSRSPPTSTMFTRESALSEPPGA
jgi:hypothetical protein